ncbi:hypothetical protein FZC79_10460 [Rossellomorea vietnamensis]|uniref:Phage gp6-like head-tail connector protein n=1 Tax=Rossellomorea vietnamensis TaxID=218284 RepID=A0A5D4KFI5_9BACI|nr:hypothetical protein [Rossellomorea vietnamensis]TYR75580.1 hypothetical protein FZC79_10460 [Rossellomorea vietnamensis]
MSITPDILNQFKDRMKLDDGEDDNLIHILSASNQELVRVCGAYDINTDETFRELVLERSRYVYNDAMEYFNGHFLSQINSLGIEKALEEIVLEDDTNATI